MKIKTHQITLKLTLIAAALCSSFSFTALNAYAKTSLATETTKSQNAENQFKDIYLKEAKFRSKEFPGRNRDGDAEELAYNDFSDSAQQRRLVFWRSLLAELKQFNASELSAESQINFRIFSDQIQNRVNHIALNAHLIPFNSDSQFWADTARSAEGQRCTTNKECERLLKQFKQIPREFNERIGLMKLGIEKGMVLPQVVLTGRDSSIQKHVITNPENSVFFSPFRSLPKELSEAQKSQLQQQARQLILSEVIPAYSNLLEFIRKEYYPKARTTIGATSLPNGAAFYQAQILEYTTLDWSADKIHQIGLEEVARIRAEMNGIIQQVNFKGDFAAFLSYLRTEPAFYAKTEHELLAEASYWAKKVDGLLPRYFGKLPRKPYGIEAVPADIAPTYTAGRYAGSGDPKRPSYYWVNTSLLSQRPMWALPALTLHEAVPGHHLQIALAGEQADQPEFRRNAYISAFGEGWALYAEHLGVEMGYYETPYQHFGRLVYEMWRAARLVVDTGMHAKGWSRDQALQFMRENTALSEHEITTEIDRYISWPAQALAYKLGEIKIRELRSHAEKSLGAQFKLADFHDQLLSLGSVPLSVLDKEMRDWTVQTLAKKNSK
jgi:uncharacterized protein (DUF885 family)